MKKFLSIFICYSVFIAKAQDVIYPAKPNAGSYTITNAYLHIGNGQVIENGFITVNKSTIEAVGQMSALTSTPKNAIDAKGKHVYPGLILPTSQLGIKEIGGNAVRGSNDYFELGETNTNIRSIAAYNTDSKIIRTVLTNGILLAHIIPQGSFISGTSSVVQLDAWNYEDAAYSIDNGINLYMPSLLPRPTGGRFGGFTNAPQNDPVKEALEKIEAVKQMFREAKAYYNSSNATPNLKFDAVKGLFSKKQKLFVHCNQVKQMLLAIDFVKEFDIEVVLVGASESFQIAKILKDNNVSVILSQQHSLPTLDDDDIDQPYKQATTLQKAGVLFCINDDDEQNRGRNLPFNAGTAAAYGLTKEEALQAITLNTAKILGIDSKTGSIEVGKDANIIISEGDVLDMRTSKITHAFIQGRQVSLDDKHKQLNERYKQKYGLK
jgi:imidazolonepropionase-like amidohydrolase